MLFVFSRASHEKRLQNKRERLGLLTEHKQRQSDAGRLRDSFRRAESQSSKGGRVALGVLSCFFAHQVCLLAVLLFGPDGVLRTRSARVYGGCAPAPPRLLLLLLVKKAPLPETGETSAPPTAECTSSGAVTGIFLWGFFVSAFRSLCCVAGKKEKTLHLSSLPRSLRLSLPFCCPAGGLVSRHVGCLSSDGAARGLVTAAYKKI